VSQPSVAPPVIRPGSHLRVGGLGIVLAATAVLALLAVFDPARYGFYPRCYFKMLTGWDCPGCGGLRAAHQLLHGHLRAAFSLNPLLFVVVPVLGWVGLTEWVRVAMGRRLPQPFQHRAWVWGLVGATVVFAVVRNLRFGPWWATAP
jgi:hypothetical protein